ncbi:MBL fold metallo-hydrolase [Ethanoligenens harbinense]|uniref:Putative metal dependent hydrolase n=1 Tax=Ethanoligenens harbinense (strain DSM 18485 / JCM 12961 / CGMCC 1.5033 / YUAN-3) TaxID=663278 RepID=E6U893_ETHHY|nr:MBL fold metallo-hydrolase [Ethanoligenens harbinense]ADU27112.1 putative metal dependent hydrolase [Ethanoligenens harbinense YUAN-3]AVQ96187.1 MBL fold metallo-hydrolase [Ethanoligenens harbinense YUAN-3]AYF38847.1 MBL fold metallo-hydrolase [Ethanoligenens harbinense]AYF41597.1 MBL fold metallo-hydrolase [Ethanoligenens harbinense]QCN92428.1 MBL fold metallo-hydrolase [Ethanoligenens harbinense]
MKALQQEADIWYLGHSGFAVQTTEHFLIFDYYNDKPITVTRGLDAGVIEPAELRDKQVVVFSSHHHADHFNRLILDWAEKLPHVRYVLSSDIRAAQGAANTTVVTPGKRLELDDVTVQTLESTDEGVAFAVETDGLSIYHAGDLNWWHWAGEPEKENAQMAAKYKREIDKLRGRHFDIAFVPVDPRLEKQYLWGLSYFMQTVGAEMVFPMHFWEDYNVFARLRQDQDAARFREPIQAITRRGQHFHYPRSAD